MGDSLPTTDETGEILPLSLARLIYDALRMENPDACIQGDPVDCTDILVDGRFDLTKISRSVILSLKRDVRPRKE